MTTITCPCGSGKAYGACCGTYLDGLAQAPDPESLMRSRYTAFCRGDAGYLTQTLDPDQIGGSPESVRQDLDRTMADTRWLGLRVIDSGMTSADKGWVEFAAFFSRGGQTGQLHEKSLFLRREGRWVYSTGEILAPVRLGRNEPCFCGSGKKHKKCHGRGG